MKLVVMSVLMFAIASCAVESAPVSTSATTDDETSVDQPSVDSTAVDPHASICEQPFGVCEPLAMCTANGGHVAGVCTGNQGICCHFNF